jgi:hypothetical protein
MRGCLYAKDNISGGCNMIAWQNYRYNAKVPKRFGHRIVIFMSKKTNDPKRKYFPDTLEAP